MKIHSEILILPDLEFSYIMLANITFQLSLVVYRTRLRIVIDASGAALYKVSPSRRKQKRNYSQVGV